MFRFTAPFSQGDCDSLFHYEARRFGGRRHQFRKYTIVGGTVMFNSWHVQCDIELVGRTYSLLNNDFSCVRILSSDLFCLPRVYFLHSAWCRSNVCRIFRLELSVLRIKISEIKYYYRITHHHTDVHKCLGIGLIWTARDALFWCYVHKYTLCLKNSSHL